MNQKSEEKLEELRQALKEDPRFQLLEQANAEVEASDEVKELARKKDRAAEEYEDALQHFGDPKKIAEKRKALFSAKLALDEHPLIVRYNQAYLPCKDLLLAIDDLLFSDYRKNPYGAEEGKC